MLPSQSSQQSQRECPSGQPRAFPLSRLIDRTMDMWLRARRPCSPSHTSACGVCSPVLGGSHTSQTHFCWAAPRSQHSSGRVSPKGPTAFNQPGHEALQMGLSAGWDRHGRVGGGGAGDHRVIVNILAPHSPPHPPTPYRVTLLGAWSWTALSSCAQAFSSAALANIFQHRAAHAGCFEKSTV